MYMSLVLVYGHFRFAIVVFFLFCFRLLDLTFLWPSEKVVVGCFLQSHREAVVMMFLQYEIVAWKLPGQLLMTSCCRINSDGLKSIYWTLMVSLESETLKECTYGDIENPMDVLMEIRLGLWKMK